LQQFILAFAKVLRQHWLSPAAMGRGLGEEQQGLNSALDQRFDRLKRTGVR
jgi:hypothetical protein